MTKRKASISALSEIETRECISYTNYIIQLIVSRCSGSWSRITGSQQFNIKTCACLLVQWYWHLLEWSTLQYPAIWCAQIFICQCVVSTAAKTYPLETTVKPNYTSVSNRGNVSYKKISYIHFNSSADHNMGLSVERKLWQYLSEIVGLLYTILYKYICYTK